MKFVCKEYKLEYKGFYYYNSVPSIKFDREIYHQQMAYLDIVRKMNKNLDVITRKLRYSSPNEILEKYYQKKQNLEQLNLCEVCKKKIEPACLSCILEKSKREKGVDVSIATDIIQKGMENEYDACILFSGDADFVPALQLIKKYERQAISAFIRCKGYSWELRQKIECIAITKEDFDDFLISP